jgi:hypothetical protein
MYKVLPLFEFSSNFKYFLLKEFVEPNLITGVQKLRESLKHALKHSFETDTYSIAFDSPSPNYSYIIEFDSPSPNYIIIDEDGDINQVLNSVSILDGKFVVIKLEEFCQITGFYLDHHVPGVYFDKPKCIAITYRQLVDYTNKFYYLLNSWEEDNYQKLAKLIDTSPKPLIEVLTDVLKDKKEKTIISKRRKSKIIYIPYET